VETILIRIAVKRKVYSVFNKLYFLPEDKATRITFAAGVTMASILLIFYAIADLEYCLLLPSWRCSMNFWDLNIYCSFS